MRSPNKKLIKTIQILKLFKFINCSIVCVTFAVFYFILFFILLFHLYVCIHFVSVLKAFEMYNIALCLPCAIV